MKWHFKMILLLNSRNTTINYDHTVDKHEYLFHKLIKLKFCHINNVYLPYWISATLVFYGHKKHDLTLIKNYKTKKIYIYILKKTPNYIVINFTQIDWTVCSP